MNELILGWATILGGFLAIAAAARALVLSSKDETEESQTQLKEEIKLQLKDFLIAIDGSEGGERLAPLPPTFAPEEETSYLNALSTYAQTCNTEFSWNIRGGLEAAKWISASSPVVNFESVSIDTNAMKKAKETILNFGNLDFLIVICEDYKRLSRLRSRSNRIGKMIGALSLAIIVTLTVIVADMVSLYYQAAGDKGSAWFWLVVSFAGFFFAVAITAFYDLFHGYWLGIPAVVTLCIWLGVWTFVDPPKAVAQNPEVTDTQAGSIGSAKGTAKTPSAAASPAGSNVKAGAGTQQQPAASAVGTPQGTAPPPTGYVK